MTDYKDCKYNTSKSASFVGYCDLPEYTTDKGQRLVECKKCPCDDFKINVHKDCENYVEKNDMCLLFFELGISDVSQYDTCAEKIIYNDKELQRKWSN